MEATSGLQQHIRSLFGESTSDEDHSYPVIRTPRCGRGELFGVDAVRLTVVFAKAWVETESQKGILVGSGGKMIRAIGTAARKELQRDLGTKVHLDLQVRVRRGWRNQDSLLDRLGFDV